MTDESANAAWTFQRLGGLDQVALRTADDLRRLDELDPKLWVALSCPASGLEFDARTLTLLDADRDGRIRIPEVLNAVRWACARLKNPADLLNPADALPLDAIAADTDEARRLAATGRAILDSLGKPDAAALTQADVTGASAHAAEQMFNGDGVLPAHPALDPDVRAFIADALAVSGGVEDAGGTPGVNADIARAFMQTLADWRAWRRGVHDASNPVGEDTPAAWASIAELKPKFDDYFLRVEVAAFAPAARDALNAEEKLAAPADHGLIDRAALAEFPLAHIEPDRPLRLDAGVNPAWRVRVERFAALLKPLLTDPDDADTADGLVLTRERWTAIQAAFAPYADTLTRKPVPVAAPGAVFPPTATAESIGDERVRQWLDGDVAARFEALAARDSDVPAAAGDILEVERLVLYHRHLYRLLRNFVSFHDFYARHHAMFQAGTLYIDGRACALCMPAPAVDAHAALAALSQCYLLYCECRRGVKPGTKDPDRVANIVAVVTAGDADLLTVGRNGVFVDTLGDDWDARVVKIVANPIGLWQAVWSPYKKFGNMVTEQISKFASDKQDKLIADAGKKMNEVVAAAPATPPAPAPGTPAKFDIGRNVGIFAAVGLAVGTIGTALAGMASAVTQMEWWQFPLVLFGLFVIVSGPSVLIAWLKLRQRTLGPLLEASGWAVNGRVKINFRLSGLLTTTADVPAHARRVLADALGAPRRKRRGWIVFWVAVLVGIGGVFGWRTWQTRRAARVEADAARPEPKPPAPFAPKLAPRFPETPPSP